ncbi:MAG: transporter substrate-binding domain-containing protein [Treponema sp.]|jgi:putative glutamine transport system substrate-binding protein|nr:transporter substrate-binding domain-containing protein [Treponema sp.]
MKRIAGIFLSAFFSVLLLSGCDSSPEKSPQVRDIRKRGVLRVGVETGVPGLGRLVPESGVFQGFEIDLARALAKELLKDEAAVQFVPLNPQFRGPVLDNGDVDIVICHFTITEERQKQYNFTSPYYTDQVGVMVRNDAGFRSLEDMDGRIIGVLKNTTSQAAIKEEADKRGISLKFEEFGSNPEAVASLHAGKVDAFVIDRTILLGYRDGRTKLLDEGFNPQPYGVATRLDKEMLAAYFDSIITAMREDGRLEALRVKWDL